ncbi:C-GCAxxG-C-C family protein [Sporomusa acidovorans]|uniref:Redox-active protein n=1 Tax=Sporomusa acidovorans (strain ATCC 49682 / DSM 3132 / Mol) TaxID=1123286 RepID=A0ABZ3J5K4_SPOA4|nr:C-GCAxxG-C-C family (seleno)protein [Sporomusa acidovorans]OZC24298.1 putative redox-active protein [Sporomusa acidovorans DSM 3132]SDF02657.1 C_GCAxxG_C_C family probable redox protein [Sporomusa acidovorans]
MIDAGNVKKMAGQNFKDGYNCTEAIVRAFRDVLGLPITDDALRMASGFGGGFGHAGCVCGALAGSVMVLGMLQGRARSEENREPVYNNSQKFHELFKEHFGATCCRILNQHPFDSRDHLRNCLKITGGTAELLMNFINEQQLALHKED